MENDREEPKLSNLEGVTTSSPDDDVDSLREKPRGIVPWVIALLIILGGAWFLFPDSEEGPAPATEPAPAAAPPAVAELPPAPDIPLPPPAPAPQAGMAGEEVSPPAPVLTLEDSDEAVRAALAEVGSTELVIAPLQQDDLLQRGTALIDGLSRGLLLNKILSLPRPEGKFVTQKSQGQEVIDPETYNRFEAVVGTSLRAAWVRGSRCR